jgi:4a-hydroxytetrahydrobiopterin dehydratase
MAKLTEREIAILLPTVPGWSVVNEEGIGRLQKTFTFGDFAAALTFTNQVGALAENANHHPRITTEWGSVTLTWWSHDLGGMVANDFDMAKRVDAL